MERETEMTGQITGRKVLAIFVGAFGIIMTVNFYMAYSAVSTFPGLVERSPYIASQTFDVDRRAQAALGWTATTDYDAERGAVVLSIREDATGLPGQVSDVSILVGRPADASFDIRPELQRKGDDFVAAMQLEPGDWIVMLEAKAQDGTAFKQRLRIFVKG